MFPFVIKFIRKVLPFKYAYYLRSFFFKLYYMITKPEKELKHKRNKNRIIVINTPEHGNLGDHAIAIAQEKFMHDKFPGCCIFEITHHCYLSRKLNIIKYISADDIIVICGGGHLGSLWVHNEIVILDVISTFSDNPIIVFPQTIFYESLNEIDKGFIKTKEAFLRHERLTIFLRDEKSYEFVKKHYDIPLNNYFLVPDIVLYLETDTSKVYDRKGVLLCLRNDKEKISDDSLIVVLTKYAENKNLELRYADTVINSIILENKRHEEIEKKLNEFRKAELVITDRLHGMIFAAITSTPCIALNNLSSKVEGVYKWIEYLGYVTFIQDFSKIGKYMDEYIIMKNCLYTNEPLMLYFDKIANAIKSNLS